MVSREEVYKVVKEKGPIIPIHIMKEIGSDTITIGAYLSELSHEKKIKISHTKIGSSPAYYTSEQAEKLQDLKKYLNDKQQRAFGLLKEKKVLRDSEMEPVIRVSLRDIKDFAKSLEVKTKEGTEIFWKWYLTPNNLASTLIKKEVLPGVEQQQSLDKIKQDKTAEQPSKKKEAEDKEEKKAAKEKTELSDDEFARKIQKYFEKKEIEIMSEDIVRKNSEINYVIKVPTPIGKQEYYCKAKNKKKSSDGDLSSAYVKGMTQRLPTIYLTTGEVTKKAEELLETDYKGLVIVKV